VELPEWVDVVKTGYAKELPPNHQDWLYIRMASIIRRVYMRCPTGVGALSRRYGTLNKRRGVRPNHTAKSAKGLIRYSMQQFEKLGWMRKAERGRKLTRKGQYFMDEFSGRISRSLMVTNYWRRRQKQERLKRKLARRRAMNRGGGKGGNRATAGGPVDDTMGGDDMDMQQQYATPQQVENVETVNEYD